MIKTLSELLLNTLKEYPKDDLMLYKKEGAYVPLSTREFGDKVRALSLGLRELGLGPRRQTRHPLREQARVGDG